MRQSQWLAYKLVIFSILVYKPDKKPFFIPDFWILLKNWRSHQIAAQSQTLGLTGKNV
nr:hypothetical protein [Nostoc sp. EkiNYC01]